MSEFVSSLLAGSMPMEAGQAPSNQLSNTVDDSEASDFASLFGDMNFASRSSTSAMTGNPAELLELTDPMFTTPISELETPVAAVNDPLATANLQYNGNSLPSNSPLLTISGYSAHADQDGASAIAFQGDGKQVLMSGTQYANSLAPAIQQSQKQLHNMTQQNALLPQDITALALQKVEMSKPIEMLTTLSPQNSSVPVDTLASLTSQQPNQMLMGLQGVTEFSNVLSASSRSPEPMTATLNQPQWNQQVGDRINWMISQGLRQAEIRLNPPELGMLEVRVQMQGDQASIQFNTAHTEVKDVLDNALPRLREMLAENGLELTDVNVSQHGQQQTKQGEESESKQVSGEPSSEVENTTDTQEIQSISGNGVIDFYA